MSLKKRRFRFTIKSLLFITAFIALMIPTAHVYLIPEINAYVRYLFYSEPPVPFLSKIPYYSNASRSRVGESDDGLIRMVTPRIKIVEEEENPDFDVSMPNIENKKTEFDKIGSYLLPIGWVVYLFFWAGFKVVRMVRAKRIAG